jgi:sulfite reductase beta subunit-like hemoprotein
VTVLLLGRLLVGPFREAEIPDAVEAILDEYLESRLQGKHFTKRYSV